MVKRKLKKNKSEKEFNKNILIERNVCCTLLIATCLFLIVSFVNSSLDFSILLAAFSSIIGFAFSVVDLYECLKDKRYNFIRRGLLSLILVIIVFPLTENLLAENKISNNIPNILTSIILIFYIIVNSYISKKK